MKTILILLLTVISIDAQVTQQWASRYDGTGHSWDYPAKVLVDKFTGNVYVTGTSLGTVNSDIVTIKYNSSGAPQWIKTYNGEANGGDEAADMVFDNLGNLIITGTSQGIGSAMDCITIKYDFNGNRIWVKRYNGTANSFDYGTAITTDGFGGVIVTGKSMEIHSGVSSEDILTVKYNYFGIQEWINRFNGIANSHDGANSICADGNSNAYVTGYTRRSAGNNDFITIKYTPTGSIEWTRTIALDSNDVGLKILNNFGGGEVYSVGISGANTLISCYDYSGLQRWMASDSGALGSVFTQAEFDEAGVLYICGSALIAGSYDYLLMAFSTVSRGSLTWAQKYNGTGSGYDYPTDIAIDKSHNVYLTGYSKGAASSNDYTTIKYNPSGVKQWEARYNFTGTTSNMPSSIDIDNSSNVIVTGYSQNFAGNYDYATVKYGQSGLLSKGSSELPSEYTLHQNFPNPFNPSTNIKFDIPLAGNVKIAVYDMLGREVSLLANEYKEAGSYEINFDASALSSGTYFYKITTGSFSEVKKMVLTK